MKRAYVRANIMRDAAWQMAERLCSVQHGAATLMPLRNTYATATQHIVGPLSSGRERHEASVPNTCSLRAHRTFWKATINLAPSSSLCATVLTRSVSLYSLRDELDTLNCAESKKSSLRKKKNKTNKVGYRKYTQNYERKASRTFLQTDNFFSASR